MKHLLFAFDVISPISCLAFERLPQVLEGLNVEVSYQPVLLQRLLAHGGEKNPVELSRKMAWTQTHLRRQARRDGLSLQMPAKHPFDSLALQRLGVACAPVGGTPSRWVCEQLVRHVWCSDGADATDAQRLVALATALNPQRDPGSVEVKSELEAATDAAIARGVFGVPTAEADGRLFWGDDGLDMLAAFLHGDAWSDAQPPSKHRRPISH